MTGIRPPGSSGDVEVEEPGDNEGEDHACEEEVEEAVAMPEASCFAVLGSGGVGVCRNRTVVVVGFFEHVCLWNVHHVLRRRSTYLADFVSPDFEPGFGALLVRCCEIVLA